MCTGSRAAASHSGALSGGSARERAALGAEGSMLEAGNLRGLDFLLGRDKTDFVCFLRLTGKEGILKPDSCECDPRLWILRSSLLAGF